MDNKGQIGLGVIIISFITVVAGLILFQVVAQQVGGVTTISGISNTTITAPAAGVAYVFTDYKLLTDVVVYNETASAIYLVPASNYTITNNVVTNGALSSTLTFVSAADGFEGHGVNVTATAQKLDYINDSGARGLAAIISIFFAIAVVLVAMAPILQEKFLFGK